MTGDVAHSAEEPSPKPAPISPLATSIQICPPTVRIRLQYGDSRTTCDWCGQPTAPAYDGTPVDLRTAEKNKDGVMVAQCHWELCPNIGDRKPKYRRRG